MIEVYVGLGSNLDSPIRQIEQAIVELRSIDNTIFIAASSLYQTKPWGMLSQPDFINAVVKLKTMLGPEDFFEHLLAIERAHLRVRKEKNGPRTLDCDLLLYGTQVIQTAILTVPHPQMTKRNFVLVPLAEIAPNIILDGKSISTYLQDNEEVNAL